MGKHEYSANLDPPPSEASQRSDGPGRMGGFESATPGTLRVPPPARPGATAPDQTPAPSSGSHAGAFGSPTPGPAVDRPGDNQAAGAYRSTAGAFGPATPGSPPPKPDATAALETAATSRSTAGAFGPATPGPPPAAGCQSPAPSPQSPTAGGGPNASGLGLQTPGPMPANASGGHAGGGRRPAPPAPSGPFPNAEAPACPLCRGELAAADGLWRCQGRCRARWLATVAGLLDVAALPFGLCGCCMPPQAMAQGRDGLAICPGSGAEYLLLADGSSLALRDAPFGLCQCCAPPRPLARQGEAMICAGRPQQAYELTAAGWRPLRSLPADASQALAEIDAALRRNAARLNVNGLFDFD